MTTEPTTVEGSVTEYGPTANEFVEAMFAAYPEQSQLVAERIRANKLAARVAELEAQQPVEYPHYRAGQTVWVDALGSA